MWSGHNSLSREGPTSVRVRLLILLCTVISCASFLGSEKQPAQRTGSAPLLYTSTPRYEPLAWLEGAERFPQGATLFIKSDGRAMPLAPDFFATADANVSFDAQSVLFSGKQQSNDHWQIWEFSVSGRTPRQVTHCDDDCIKPLYVPGERLVYSRKFSGHFAIEIASLNSETSPLQLTHTPGNAIPNDVLRDGRILFASDFPLDNGTTAELYTVYTDGSGVESYRCDHGSSRHSGKQVSSGDVVFARDGKLFRFTSARADEVAIAAPAGSYAGDVIEDPSGEWIVSARAASSKFFELLTWKAGAATSLPLARVPKANIVQPALLAERPIPNRHPSALHEWSYANTLCLNAYTSKDHMAEGAIASVRLYTRDAQGGTQVQGTAQVEKDGSFYLRIPGDVPLRIELLDAGGKTLKSEAGWFWLRSGEQRICVGCHAGPERAPDNAVPMVLQRSTVAADLTTPHKFQAPAAGGH
jgi:hypothetical protein